MSERVVDERGVKEKPRHPMNASGPFYVENGICLMCGVLDIVAPDLIGYMDEEYSHCYFKKQPKTPEELERAIKAIDYSEVQGLRYAGNDPDILNKLIERGCKDCCDALSDNTNE